MAAYLLFPYFVPRVEAGNWPGNNIVSPMLNYSYWYVSNTDIYKFILLPRRLVAYRPGLKQVKNWMGASPNFGMLKLLQESMIDTQLKNNHLIQTYLWLFS